MIAGKAVETLKKTLKKHNQSHLLAFWEQLDADQRRNLLEQLQGLNFPQIDLWVSKYVKGRPGVEVPADFMPAEYYPSTPKSAAQQYKYTQARQLGRKLIAAGKVAAFVVAGGQATRLGFDGPKGNYRISPVQGKTLFQVFAETIAAVRHRYGAVCPWYIMTSPLNYAETVQIFRSNDYYGLNEKSVCIFQQGTLPNFDFDGRILMAETARIACSPDGHGGSLKALYRSGAIEDMKKHGVEFVSYFQVDNPLVKVFDPLFIGLHVLDEAQMSSKAVIKTGPMERVGNFCLVDGRVTVIEYSDLPETEAAKQKPDGSLVFELGSIAIHIISTSFIEKLNTEGFSLPLHRAVKKVSHIDDTGRLIEPAEPNGIKLESFVFDALPLASNSVILETLRTEEFAPVKNAAGIDSPETAGKMMVARAAGWLESAGANVPRKPDGSVDCLIEMAPSFALEKDDVAGKLKQIPEIKPGDRVYLC